LEAANDPLFWITLLIMLLGLVGSVLPGLPGVPLIFTSALVYAYLTHFEVVGAGIIVLLGVFALISFLSDFLATSYGARRFGASNWGTVSGTVGGLACALVGAPLLGIGAVLGLLLGTAGGVFLGEYLRHHKHPASTEGEPRVRRVRSGRWDWRRASRAASGVLIGYLFNIVAQSILGLLSVIVFVLALFY
jgi:uncharacterized protein